MLHPTKQLSPALNPPQPVISYVGPCDESAAQPEIAAQVGKLPLGFALESVFCDAQVNVAAAEPVYPAAQLTLHVEPAATELHDVVLNGVPALPSAAQPTMGVHVGSVPVGGVAAFVLSDEHEYSLLLPT